MSGTRAVMVDIGGVILATHEDRTARMLAEAAAMPVEEILARIQYESRLGEDLFLGRRTFAEVHAIAREQFGLAMEYDAFAAAWMAMLGEDYPQVRAALEALPPELPLYTLSNTSELHMEVLGRHWVATRSREFFASCRMGLCKPDPAVYRHVLERIALPPRTVLFFDDNARNVAAAREAGIDAVHVTHPDVVGRTLVERGLIPPPPRAV